MDRFEACREGGFGAAGKARDLPSVLGASAEDADLVDAAEINRERAVDKDD